MNQQPMSPFQDLWLIQVGVHGQIGRFLSRQSVQYTRGRDVVCRTERGIERGRILGPSRQTNHVDGTPQGDGMVLRQMTPEDQVLWQHLQELSQEAFEQCEGWLQECGIDAKLLEVEPLLDGKTIYFHFLHEVPASLQTRLNELAEVYERKVRDSKFAALLEHGCGPGCGTAAAKNGCGSKGGCAVCKVASACQSAAK